MPDKPAPTPPIAVSDSATGKDKALEPAQPPVEDPEEEAAGGLDVPTGD